LVPLIRAAGLPMPATQAYIVLDDGEPPMRRDFVWFDHKVNVETDGGTHLTRQQKELDAFNDERLVAARWRVVRITWRRLQRDPAGVIRTIASLLGC
jgi:very-short-patch-repair endonuclease